jgi:hypothetical protein
VSVFVLSPEIEDRDKVEVGNWAKREFRDRVLETHFGNPIFKKKLLKN